VRRLYGSPFNIGNGAVYRDVGNTNECYDSFILTPFEKPTCYVYPPSSEHLASFPYHFGEQSDIDTIPFNDNYSVLDGVSYDPDYPNLWNKLSTPEKEAILIYADQCFCQGDGIDMIRLITGRPRFPTIDPLPWFYIPTTVTPLPFSVREKNPDGPPLPNTCCPDGKENSIIAEVVNGELHLQRRERPEKDYTLRQVDRDESFQRQSGYPRWCCLPDPNEPGKYTMRYLEFPLWPRIDTHDAAPDTAGAKKEPLGLIPVVVDIGCTEAGTLKVYWANLVIHDGKLSDIQWDVLPPRPGPFAGNNYEVPPDDPEVLVINTDYQGNVVLVDGFAAPVAPDGKGNTCDDAAAVLGLAPCNNICPPDVDICPPGGTSTEVTENGPTFEDAINNAFLTAELALALAACDSPIHVCYVLELPNNTYDAKVKYCC
jgi:hypothetical protein